MTGVDTIGGNEIGHDKRLDVIVIGAGQAGLAVAWHLALKRQQGSFHNSLSR
jgi:cation diffusion facilitator CzcD-associated flavoprotein CzcO